MSVYGESVDVQTRDDGRPTRFIWRSQLYVVLAILEHWFDGRAGVLDPHSEPGHTDLEFWRVEARAGPGTTPGVYELRRETATNSWYMRWR
jgi:hypothetical protein